MTSSVNLESNQGSLLLLTGPTLLQEAPDDIYTAFIPTKGKTGPRSRSHPMTDQLLTQYTNTLKEMQCVTPSRPQRPDLDQDQTVQDMWEIQPAYRAYKAGHELPPLHQTSASEVESDGPPFRWQSKKGEGACTRS
jgi:hypothetical protein